MSVEAMCFAFVQSPPSPLMKLILVAAGDQVDGSGLWVPDLDWLTKFCCCSREGVEAAIAELMTGGWLVAGVDQSQFKLGGYEPRVHTPDHNRYHKQIISMRLRRIIYARDGNVCRICGTAENLSVDHIHPERYGGTLDPDNLQTLCRPCNSRKGSKVR